MAHNHAAWLLRHRAIKDVSELSPLDQDNFSRKFISDLIEDYSKALTWIYSQQSHNKDLKTFMDVTRQDLLRHLKKAQAIQANVLR